MGDLTEIKPTLEEFIEFCETSKLVFIAGIDNNIYEANTDSIYEKQGFERKLTLDVSCDEPTTLCNAYFLSKYSLKQPSNQTELSKVQNSKKIIEKSNEFYKEHKQEIKKITETIVKKAWNNEYPSQ